MNNKVCLVLISDINRADFLNNSAVQSFKDKGTSFQFERFFPLQPGTAIAYIMTGSNPGRTGFLDACNLLSIEENKGDDRTLISLMHHTGCSAEYVENDLPSGNSALSLVKINDIVMLERVLDIAETLDTTFFIIAPVFGEYVQKTVNINNFFKDKEIIETDKEGAIIWENSLAYQKGYGQIWINLIGRDAEGVVLPGEEYDEVRNAIIKGMTEKLVDDDNKGVVVDWIRRKEEFFNGEYMSTLPDLIVSLKEGYGFSHLSNDVNFDAATIMRKESKTYFAGTGIALGKGIISNQELENMEISAVCPSILYCLGHSIPAWMDGRVEEKMFNNEIISNAPPKYDDVRSSELSKEDDTLIKERLKGLGYL